MEDLFTDKLLSNNLSCSNVEKKKTNNHSVFKNGDDTMMIQ